MPDCGSETQNRFCIILGSLNPCFNGRTYEPTFERYLHIVLKTPKAIQLTSRWQVVWISEDWGDSLDYRIFLLLQYLLWLLAWSMTDIPGRNGGCWEQEAYSVWLLVDWWQWTLVAWNGKACLRSLKHLIGLGKCVIVHDRIGQRLLFGGSQVWKNWWGMGLGLGEGWLVWKSDSWLNSAHYALLSWYMVWVQSPWLLCGARLKSPERERDCLQKIGRFSAPRHTFPAWQVASIHVIPQDSLYVLDVLQSSRAKVKISAG